MFISFCGFTGGREKLARVLRNITCVSWNVANCMKKDSAFSLQEAFLMPTLNFVNVVLLRTQGSYKRKSFLRLEWFFKVLNIWIISKIYIVTK